MGALEVRDVVFVGLGQMGRAMVRHLHSESRFSVVGVDVSPSSRNLSKAFGLVVYDSIEELTGWGDCIVACLPLPDDVLELAVHCGELSVRVRPRFFINLSTIGPKAAARVEECLSERCPEVVYVECPITGGVLRAARKECSLLYGCRDRRLLGPVMPLLAAMASSVIYLGSITAASIAKLVNNVAAINIALGTLEALALGVQSGLDLPKLFEVMSNGTAASYILLSALHRALIGGDFRTGFSLRLAAKDMRLALQHAAESGCELPHTRITLQQLDDGIAAQLGDYTFPVIAAISGIVPAHGLVPSIARGSNGGEDGC